MFYRGKFELFREWINRLIRNKFLLELMLVFVFNIKRIVDCIF